MADVKAPAVSPVRLVRAPRGPQISCKSWQQEAALRMLMNNLDPEVAELVRSGAFLIEAASICGTLE